MVVPVLACSVGHTSVPVRRAVSALRSRDVHRCCHAPSSCVVLSVCQTLYAVDTSPSGVAKLEQNHQLKLDDMVTSIAVSANVGAGAHWRGHAMLRCASAACCFTPDLDAGTARVQGSLVAAGIGFTPTCKVYNYNPKAKKNPCVCSSRHPPSRARGHGASRQRDGAAVHACRLTERATFDSDFKEEEPSQNAVTFNAAGDSLATGGDDSTVRVWKLTTDDAEQVHAYTGHKKPVNGVSFNPSGTLVRAPPPRLLHERGFGASLLACGQHPSRVCGCDSCYHAPTMTRSRCGPWQLPTTPPHVSRPLALVCCQAIDAQHHWRVAGAAVHV